MKVEEREGKRKEGSINIQQESIVKCVWRYPVWCVEEVRAERGWWILTRGGDTGGERARGVSGWRSNLPARWWTLLFTSYIISRRQRPPDSESISSDSDGRFSLFKYLAHTLQSWPGERLLDVTTRESHIWMFGPFVSDVSQQQTPTWENCNDFLVKETSLRRQEASWFRKLKAVTCFLIEDKLLWSIKPGLPKIKQMDHRGWPSRSHL